MRTRRFADVAGVLNNCVLNHLFNLLAQCNTIVHRPFLRDFYNDNTCTNSLTIIHITWTILELLSTNTRKEKLTKQDTKTLFYLKIRLEHNFYRMTNDPFVKSLPRLWHPSTNPIPPFDPARLPNSSSLTPLSNRQTRFTKPNHRNQSQNPMWTIPNATIILTRQRPTNCQIA